MKYDIAFIAVLFAAVLVGDCQDKYETRMDFTGCTMQPIDGGTP